MRITQPTTNVSRPAQVRREDALLWSEPWPADVSAGLIEALTALAQPRQLQDGETLYARGDPASGLIGVRRGMIRNLLVTADGREMIAGMFAAGTWFGERPNAVISRSQYSSSQVG